MLLICCRVHTATAVCMMHMLLLQCAWCTCCYCRVHAAHAATAAAMKPYTVCSKVHAAKMLQSACCWSCYCRVNAAHAATSAAKKPFLLCFCCFCNLIPPKNNNSNLLLTGCWKPVTGIDLQYCTSDIWLFVFDLVVLIKREKIC